MATASTLKHPLVLRVVLIFSLLLISVLFYEILEEWIITVQHLTLCIDDLQWPVKWTCGFTVVDNHNNCSYVSFI